MDSITLGSKERPGYLGEVFSPYDFKERALNIGLSIQVGDGLDTSV